MVFNEKLEFEFPPVEFKTLFSNMNTVSFQTDSGIYLLSSIVDNSSPRTIFPTYLSDIQGNLVDSIFIGPKTGPTLVIKESPGIYAFADNFDIYKITDFRKPEFLANIKDLNGRKLIFIEIGIQRSEMILRAIFFVFVCALLIFINKEVVIQFVPHNLSIF